MEGRDKLYGNHGSAALEGNEYIGSNAVGGVAPGTAFSTTPPLFLWNQLGSGVNLVIRKATMDYVSGTLGAGCVAIGQVAQGATIPTTGTELTPVNSKLGFPRGAGRLFTGSTVVAAPTLVKTLFSMGAALATTALGIGNAENSIDGDIVVPPGMGIAVQGIAAAGTTPLVILGLVWEETVASA